MVASAAIPLDEIRFDNTSFIDPNSRTFHWQGGIYRAIMPGMAEFYRNLLSKDWFAGLQKRGLLIETEITDHTLEGFAMVLKHRKVPVLSYCPEWPPALLKKAAILTLELCLELVEHKLSLQDAYPWNVLFDGTKPVFVDFGSICPFDNRSLWAPYQQFCNFFLFPLYLYAAGIEKPTRFQLLDFQQGITHQDCSKLLSFGSKMKSPGAFSRLEIPRILEGMVNRGGSEGKVADISHSMEHLDLTAARRSFFKGLLKDVRNIKLPKRKTVWSDYIQGDPSFENSSGWSAKQKIISELFDRLKTASVLDIAGNKGWFSMLAARKGIRAVSFDIDEGCVASLAEDAAGQNLNVLPLVMNVLNPTPAFGWCLKQFPSAMDRIHGDLTMALALIHHLVISQWQSFPRVAELLDSFTDRWLLVEFVPREDEKAQILLSRKTDAFEWYTLENFMNALKARFAWVEVFDSHPEGRKLLLCHRS